MSQYSEDPWSSTLSTEELTWLQASALIEDSPFIVDDDDPSADFDSLFFSPPLQPQESSIPPTGEKSDLPEEPTSSEQKDLPSTPRSEWIYRRPKAPSARSPDLSSHSRPRPSPGHARTHTTLSRSRSSASSRPTAGNISNQSISSRYHRSTSSSGQFWSTVLQPRSRSERSIPLLKTIPSQSQIVLTPSDLTTMDFSRISTPKSMSARPPSVSSSLSSFSHSPSTSRSSSRSESPVTPVSIPSSPYGKSHQRRHRRHHLYGDSVSSSPQLSASCPPSKSILTRSSSISTKDSLHGVNKSVKFAAVPVVHYASTGYWDLETQDGDMGIEVENMDMDDSSEEYRSHVRNNEIKALDIAKFRELQSLTPAPELEKAKRAKSGLKQSTSLSKQPPSTRGTHASAAAGHTASLPTRPLISTPYVLGSHPASSSAMRSTTSLRSTQEKSQKPGAGSAGHTPLRSAPSLESFRSSKSTTRSVRSMSSMKSNSSIRGLKSWLGRGVGWMGS